MLTIVSLPSRHVRVGEDLGVERLRPTLWRLGAIFSCRKGTLAFGNWETSYVLLQDSHGLFVLGIGGRCVTSGICFSTFHDVIRRDPFILHIGTCGSLKSCNGNDQSRTILQWLHLVDQTLMKSIHADQNCPVVVFE